MIPVLDNPLATRTTALYWVAALKVLDVASTLAAYYATPGFRELNVLINAVQPYIGFEAAVVLTAPLALGIIYLSHDQYPVLSEIMIVFLRRHREHGDRGRSTAVDLHSRGIGSRPARVHRGRHVPAPPAVRHVAGPTVRSAGPGTVDTAKRILERASVHRCL